MRKAYLNGPWWNYTPVNSAVLNVLQESNIVTIAFADTSGKEEGKPCHVNKNNIQPLYAVSH